MQLALLKQLARKFDSCMALSKVIENLFAAGINMSKYEYLL